MYFVFVMAALQVVNAFVLTSPIKSLPLRVLMLLLFFGLAAFMVMFGISLYVLCERGLKPNVAVEEDKYRQMANQMTAPQY
jgi:hypothetical protein